MTAESFADLVHARSAGRGRWMARCPAHDDRSPSLNISEGRDGRVLLHCFAGCSLATILKALSLSTRDLFASEPLSPQQQATLKREREARDAQRARERQADRAAWDRVRALEATVSALGDRLMRTPEDDGLDGLFHLALERLRDAEYATQTKRPAASGPVKERIA